MSDFRAIGGVSATLRTLVHDRMDFPDNLSDVLVTVAPPPLAPADQPALEDPRVTLFLYRVTENGSLQNQEIPGNGNPGVYGKPPLSLNLHYLLTASGNVLVHEGGGARGPIYDETRAHLILGSAMRVLHDYAVVTTDLVTQRVPSGLPILDSSLRDAYEDVKLTLEPLSLEDVTKVWTALGLRYRLSAGYLITVVQIETRTPRTFPRPVGAPASATVPPPEGALPPTGPNVEVVLLRAPFIEQINVRHKGVERPFPYARVGDTLIILGTELKGGATRVTIGALDVAVTPLSSKRIEATVPDATLPDVGPIPSAQILQPGMTSVSVTVSDASLLGPPVRSNESVLMLVPNVATPVLYDPVARTLTITGTRLWNATTSGQTVIGRVTVRKDQYVSATDTQLVVPVPVTLPSNGVKLAVSGPLPATLAFAGPQSLIVSIDGTPLTVAPNNLPPSVALSDLPTLLGNAIRDAATGASATDIPAFTLSRIGIIDGNRLAVVPGTLGSTVTITPDGASTLAATLGFTAAALPGASNVLLSGALVPLPPMEAPSMILTAQAGALPPVTLTFPPALSLATLAANLEAALAAFPTAAYGQTLVGVMEDQLAVIPGAAVPMSFSAAPGDQYSAAALQLQASFGVRVRVNGADSLDDVSIALP